MSEVPNDDHVALIDIGNSTIKVSALSDPASLVFHCEKMEELCCWLLTKQFLTSIYCANVRTKESLIPLERFCDEKNIALSVIATGKEFAGLKNSYQNESNMGVDRWLSMLACTKLTQSPFAVLMFGTAITCDIVANGQHLGGWIIPGRKLMQDALTKNTARVFCEQSNAQNLDVGQSTPDCVDTGCFAAALGVITMAESYLCSRFEQKSIFLTGGDKKVLTAVNRSAIFRVENLVLQGLTCYAKPS